MLIACTCCAKMRRFFCAVVAAAGVAGIRAPAYGQTESPQDSPPPSLAPESEPPLEPRSESEGEGVDETAASSRSDRRAKARRFLFSLAGGYAWQSLYGTDIHGGDVEAVLGAELRHVSIGGTVDVGVGSTEYGLGTLAVMLGFLIEGRIGAVRLGGGMRLGGFHVTRATDGSELGSLSAGVYGRLTVDLVQFGLDPQEDGGDRALFLVAKGAADTVGGDLYSLVGGMGVRF